MADFTSLNLGEPDPLDWDHLDLPGEGFPPIPDGKYTFQSPSTVDFDARDGRLRGILPTVIIVGPSHVGEKLGKHWISTKKYDKRNSSPAAEYFAACGLAAQPKTWNEYEQLFRATANQVWQGTSQQRAFCNHKETAFAGHQAFQLDGEQQMAKGTDGKSLPTFECPTCKKRVFVNSQVRRFLPPPQGGKK